jgi:hypothetical protein
MVAVMLMKWVDPSISSTEETFFYGPLTIGMPRTGIDFETARFVYGRTALGVIVIERIHYKNDIHGEISLSLMLKD